MKIAHVALYTNKLEEMKNFYEKFFNGKANNKYINASKGFESYFITFESGARLEIMQQQGIAGDEKLADNQRIGFTHMAFSVGSRELVDELTAKLQENGYETISGPRVTGDGYYESCILDPDSNMVEITV